VPHVKQASLVASALRKFLYSHQVGHRFYTPASWLEEDHNIFATKLNVTLIGIMLKFSGPLSLFFSAEFAKLYRSLSYVEARYFL